MHLNSKLLFEKHAKNLFTSGARVLEIGPDGFPSTYKQIVGDSSITWETLDLYSSEKLNYTATKEHVFPIPTDTFDIVLSGQVIEHVRKIWVWIKEVARVCKKGGFVITINPINWPYHQAPVDCWRIYPEGMKALYEEAGLEIDITTFETLEPNRFASLYLLKQTVKTILGRKPYVASPVIDTISIGIKK